MPSADVLSNGAFADRRAVVRIRHPTNEKRDGRTFRQQLLVCQTQEGIMKTVLFTTLLAFVLIGFAGCTNTSSGPYGDPSMVSMSSDGSGSTLHPISGTDEGVEMFKDDDSD
jgi:hypothetical protein